MTIDPYSTCPCQSGKKLKFCCIDIAGEMEKIIQLQQGHQVKAAIKSLDKIDQKHPGNAWVSINRATLLLSQDQFEEARSCLQSLLEKQPGHIQALVLDAMAAFEEGGYERAKKPMHRATQAVVKSRSPHALLITLLTYVSSELSKDSKSLASRQHLALAMRLAPPDFQQEIFELLLQFDSDQSLPHPFRGVHPFPTLQIENADDKKQYQKGLQLHNIGCWEEAAKIFSGLTEKMSENAETWHLLGLMQAWDGNEVVASKSLHQAAQLYRDKDRETAIELETLSQVLNLNATEKKNSTYQRVYKVTSSALLLTAFEKSDLIYHDKTVDPNQSGQSYNTYYLFEKPLSDEWKTEGMPSYLAPIFFSDEDATENRQAEIGISCKPDNQEAVERILNEIAGDFFTELPAEESVVLRSTHPPKELAGLLDNRLYCDKLSGSLIKELRRERWKQYAQEEWMNQPLEGLNGKTPAEAKGDAELEIELIASVMVLDIFADLEHCFLGIKGILDQLDCQPPCRLEVREETKMQNLSYSQLRRVQVGELSDDQMQHVMTRALLMRHNVFLEVVLKEAISRKELLPQLDLHRTFETLGNLAEDKNNYEEAIQWIQRGWEEAQKSEEPFRESLFWEMQELRLRRYDRESPEFSKVLLRLYDHYGKKLPQIKTFLEEFVKQYDLTPPWKEGLLQGVEGSSTGTEKKLWLPGQD